MRMLIIIPLLFQSVYGVGQGDSTIVIMENNDFVEIKSLRYVLRRTIPCPESTQDTNKNILEGCIILENFIPRGPNLKDGLVVIKDRLNRPLAIYFYADSFPIQEDHYYEGRVEWQLFTNPKDSTGIDKYYWKNGNLRNIIYYGQGQQKVYYYSEDGKFIKSAKE